MDVPLDKIVILERSRSDMGNLNTLKSSIQSVGLLQPIVLNSRMELVAGGRRLEACRNLGWNSIPATIANTLDDAVLALRAELHENSERKSLTPMEIVEHGRRLEDLEKPEAAKRKTAGANQHTEPSGNLPEGSNGQTRDKVAAALGVSGRTYEKANAVVEAAEQEPERFGDLAVRLAEPKASVDPVYREMKGRQAEQPSQEPGRFSPGVIMAHEATNCLTNEALPQTDEP